MATRDEILELRGEAIKALLEAIIHVSHSQGSSTLIAQAVKDFAEAYAWLESPGVGHGGSTQVTSS